jgi:hypothetical protein
VVEVPVFDEVIALQPFGELNITPRTISALIDWEVRLDTPIQISTTLGFPETPVVLTIDSILWRWPREVQEPIQVPYGQHGDPRESGQESISNEAFFTGTLQFGTTTVPLISERPDSFIFTCGSQTIPKCMGAGVAFDGAPDLVVIENFDSDAGTIPPNDTREIATIDGVEFSFKGAVKIAGGVLTYGDVPPEPPKVPALSPLSIGFIACALLVLARMRRQH